MAVPAGPIGCAQVLDDELRHLRPERRTLDPSVPPEPTLEVALRQAQAEGLSALCLSGGGIRSASFALGVLEGLCRRGLIDDLDYLSTVSGGGYAGGWLSAWRRHAAGQTAAVAWPAAPPKAGGPAEPEPLIRVRRYSRYLAPHNGFFSVDLWALLATVGRNLLLMWLVLLPIISSLLILPYIYFALVRAADRDLVDEQQFTMQESSTWVLLGSAVLLAVALGFVVRDLPSLGGRGGTQRQFLVWCLAPLCLGAVGLTLFWASDTVPITFKSAIVAAAIATPASWAIAGLRTERRWRPMTWMASAIAGPLAIGGMWTLANGSFGFGHPLEYDYATLAFPFVLGLIAIAAVVHIGLSREETSDEDLEWWSRFGGWLLIVIVSWLGASVVVLCLPLLFRWVAHQVVGMVDVPGISLSGALGVLTSLAGGIATRAARPSQGSSRETGPIRAAVTALAAPAFVVLLLAFVASANLELIGLIHVGHLKVGLPLDALLERARLLEAVVLLATMLGVGLLMAVFVPVNKYSLHGMYRNRLIRTFLGASRPSESRHPSPFTGFDSADDLAMSELASLPRPLHVINATLNMVSAKGLGMQQRKSESFTISPLHAGSWTLGFRPAEEYARERHADTSSGITLGTAITISGAAASPNMGAASRPSLTFLLTLFNARLGAWLGNPGKAGHKTWQDADPRLGPAPLLRELFGLTSDRSPYVFLSDGGHYENLGLYEMVRRRCHCIIVSDAGCDPDYTFEDLSNAVRKIRIDFSIPIDFAADGIGMNLAGQGKGNSHVAIGTIKYSAIDRDATDGVLVYMKATLSGDEPADVLNYARSHHAFPHESTSNQFFTEAQFESYRMLGVHTVDQSAALIEAGLSRTSTATRLRVQSPAG